MLIRGRAVGDLRDNGDFVGWTGGGFGGLGSAVVRGVGRWGVDFEIQTDEGAAPAEDDQADADVNENVEEDDDPDGAVEAGNAQGVPFDGYPAP